MSKEALRSRAFQHATLRSEAYRTAGMLCFLAALGIFVIARAITTQDRIVALQIAFLAIVITHEFFMLRAIRKALRDEKEMPPDKWMLRNGEEFGLRRLESAIRQSHDCSAEEVISKLRFAVEDFCGGTEQKDDLTAVVLKRKAVATRIDERRDSRRSTEATVFVEVGDSYPQQIPPRRHQPAKQAKA